MRNGLAPAHRRYLAAGGLGFFIGDGQLNYAAEQVAEAYYSLALRERLWLAADAQYIRNPAYNADRGPVRLWALRLHAEF
jgi:carbohydrate-selective porin OprB